MYKSQHDKIEFDSQSLLTLMILNMGYMPKDLYDQFKNWSEDQIEASKSEDQNENGTHDSDRKFNTMV